MAQSDFQDPPQAQGYWQVNMSKMSVLFWKYVTGQIGPSSTINGALIPTNNEQVLSYVGGTNNVETIVYKMDGVAVATQSFTYKAGGAADDDDVIRIVTTY